MQGHTCLAPPPQSFLITGIKKNGLRGKADAFVTDGCHNCHYKLENGTFVGADARNGLSVVMDGEEWGQGETKN